VASLSYSLQYGASLGIPWGVCPPLVCRNEPVFGPHLSEADKIAALRLLIGRVRRRRFASFVFTCSGTSPNSALLRQEFVRAGFRHRRPLNPVRHPGLPGLMTPQAGDDPAVNKRRSHINNARGKLELIPGVSADDFIAFYDANLKARGKKRSYLDAPLARSLLRESVARGQARLLATRRKTKSPGESAPSWDAAIAFVWDRPMDVHAEPSAPLPAHAPVGAGGRCYLLLLTYRIHTPGSRPEEKPVADANKVLIMEAAEFAAHHGMTFDTGGWATPGARKFYRQLFPGEHSSEFLDVFQDMRPYARWFNRQRLVIKRAAARHGIQQLTLSRHNLRMIRQLLAARMRRGAKPVAVIRRPEAALHAYPASSQLCNCG
jgi:hypothetical protein